jgi:hypothetical protein
MDSARRFTWTGYVGTEPRRGEFIRKVTRIGAATILSLATVGHSVLERFQAIPPLGILHPCPDSQPIMF